MRIAVLHNAVLKDARLDDLDTLVQVDAISNVFTAAGHEAIAVPCTLDLFAVQSALSAIDPALVVNLVESLDGTGTLIHLVPAVVEHLGLPMTGCSSQAIYQTSDKLLAKERLRACSLPVPDWFGSGGRRIRTPFPSGRLIAKSRWEHASVGMDASSVFFSDSHDTVFRVLEERRASFGGDWFVEQFIDGREFNVSVLEGPHGPRVFPPAEIRFVNFPCDAARIVDYRAKWETDSYEYTHTVRSFEFPPEDETLLKRLGALAMDAVDVFGAKGYARVDFRVNEKRQPFILEVNANPCLSPDAGFAAAAKEYGIEYDDLIFEIATTALGCCISRKPEGAAPLRLPIRDRSAFSFRENVTAADREAIDEMVRGTGFFTEDEVGIALELVDAYVEKGTASGYHFLVCEEHGKPIGFTTFGPIPGTASSFDLYWIVVHRRHQRRGLGALLCEKTQACVRALEGTRLYAETSGRDLYAATQAFYERNGFVQEARIRDYYASGDDQLIYVKALSEHSDNRC